MNSKAENLCSHCSRLDFDALFHYAIRVEVNRKLSLEIELGFLHEIAKRKDCPFCRLVTKTIRLHYDENDLPISFWETGLLNGNHVRCVLYNTRVPDPGDDEPPDPSRKHVYHLEIGTDPAIYRSDLRIDGDDNQEFLLPMIQMLRPPMEPDRDRPLPYGALVRSQINISKPLDWLNFCQIHAQTPSIGSRVLKTPRDLRVIDVLRQCVLPAPERARYVALSYVWGGDQRVTLKRANAEEFGQVGSLSRQENFPRTIRDATEFVRRLGERYLWVDSLCIIQDNEIDVGFQVDSMDSIYANALLVLVGAAGHDADAGLPGVVRGSRMQRQHIENVGQLQLANMLGNKRELITRSVWNSRAWTYQEGILASRLLTFTKDQLFFECTYGCSHREELYTSRPYTVPTSSTGDFSYHPLLREGVNFDIYARIVSEYTGRQMSQPSDAIKALSGVLQLFEYAYDDRKAWEGLPSIFWDAALLWRPAGPTKRRLSTLTGKPEFPSWTWAGWEGRIHYPDLLNFCITNHSCVDWDPQKTPNDSETIHGYPPVSKLSQRQFDPDTLSIYYTRKGDDPGLWYSLPILEHGFSPGPKSLDDHQLLLEAPMASFNLTGEHHVGMRPLFLRCTEEKHTLCPLAVFSEEGYVAGTVFVDADIARTIESGAYEFLALSRTTLYRNNEDPAWDDETNTFLPNEADRKIPHAADDTFSEEDLGYRERTRYFDYTRYSPRKYWPLYNVLLVKRSTSNAPFRRDHLPAYERIGIGKIHSDAFNGAGRKILALA